MLAVEFRGVSKVYHRQPVLQGVSLSIEASTFAVIFGTPSCGKSVLVRLLAGLEPPTEGQVFLRGADVTHQQPGERNIGYIPQSFALYPHYKVYDNIAYSLKLRRVPHSDIRPIVERTAEMLRITPLLSKTPDQLSGGEKQRVAIARGIVKDTDIFVLDDPLTGLDFKLREQLFDDLKQMQESLGATFVYTTSDPLEALMLAEKIALLDGGRVIEAGSLEEVYAAPQHLRTMTLLGTPQASLFPGHLAATGGKTLCRTELFEFPVELNGNAPATDEVTVAVRPQDIRFATNGGDGLLTQQAQIMLREDLGGELVVHLEARGVTLVSVVSHDDAHMLAEDQVTIGVPPQALVLYAPQDGRRVGQGAE